MVDKTEQLQMQINNLASRLQSVEQAFINLYSVSEKTSNNVNESVDMISLLANRIKVAEAVVGLTAQYYLATLRNLDPVAAQELEGKIQEHLKNLPVDLTTDTLH